MASNLDRYKKDLDSLIKRGTQLDLAIRSECQPDVFKKATKRSLGGEAEGFLKSLPSFRDAYQLWYSEAKAVVSQLLPHRISDFVRYYEKPKGRREITYENYTIEDYLQGLSVTRTMGLETQVLAGPDAAVPKFRQQLAILESVRPRLESSLFDIAQLARADLFDSELDAAAELLRNKFTRAAGAVAGVVLERHLAQVCDGHGLKSPKRNATIANLNDTLKAGGAVDVPTWRFIQHLADIRNLCDHDRSTEPSTAQVQELIGGVMKVTKTLF